MEELGQSLMFQRPSKESHVATIHYELGMLRYTLDWLNQHGTRHEPQEELFAILECFLLHYRNVVKFLSGKGGKHDLKIDAPQRWADRSVSTETLEEIAKLAKGQYTCYNEDVSTYLAHCTQKRFEQKMRWNPNQMYGDLEPAITKFEALFGKAQPERPQRVQDSETFGTATVTYFGTPEKVVYLKGETAVTAQDKSLTMPTAPR